MQKKTYYYISGGFGNIFDLVYILPGEEPPENGYRITRREAINYCVQENRRSKYEDIWGSTTIEPYHWDGKKRYELKGYIWEEKAA